MLMDEENGEEVDRNEFNKRSSETGQNARDVGEESRSDTQISREEEKGEEVNVKKLNKKRRKTVKKSQNGSGDNEDSGSDVVMLMEEEKGEEVDRNELNKRNSVTGQNARDVGEGSRSGTKISREEEKGGKVHPKTLNKRRRKTVKKSQIGSRDNEESGTDDVILMEHEKGEEDDQNELNKSINETGQNAHDVGEGSRSGAWPSEDDSLRKNAANNEQENSVGEDATSGGKIRGSEDVLKRRKVHASDTEADSSKSDEVRRNEDDGYDDPVPKLSTNNRTKEENLPERGSDVSPDLNFIKVLLDSMLKEGATLEEKPAPVEEKATSQNVLPLKFKSM
ncbi:hypothetical protein ACH5RR_040380 [Cinchona calisaya]|uniref:Uncharacterized protein n=1 Tax=Cinchona calisaya TaxID=153742 RepID=A0ABD2XSM4_9GENT